MPAERRQRYIRRVSVPSLAGIVGYHGSKRHGVGGADRGKITSFHHRSWSTGRAMNTLLLLACVVVGQAEPRVDLQFVQVGPPQGARLLQRSAGQTRAVVLVHGLRLHPFNNRQVSKAELSIWQKPRSGLVTALAKEADVFALAYSQNAALDTIAGAPALVEHLRRLKELGYGDIVLVGHSAGGVLARHLVEDEPDLGVTMVVQIGAPNGGSSLAAAAWSLRRDQEAFVESLSQQARAKMLAARAKRVPEKVALVSIVCQVPVPERTIIRVRGAEVEIALKRGDGVVSCGCQWPADLQEQGIPVLVLPHDHVTAMYHATTAEAVLQLLREPPPRWTGEQVAAARGRVFGSEPPALSPLRKAP
jgi:pimeloyl-ACP methyl ester carboxylesterase